MPTGLSFPVAKSPSGGMATTSGTEQDKSIISLALASDETDNAFQQDEGVGVDGIFDINDPLSRAAVLSRVRSVFQRFEKAKRFKLLEETIRWDDNTDNGDMKLSFKYISLESDSEEDFSQKFSSAQAQSKTNG